MRLNIESKKEQLKRAVLEDVQSGRYKPGERLPSEREFTERYPISRITVKAALNELESAGVLFRRKGSGTYVSITLPPKPAVQIKIRARIGFVIHRKWYNHVAFATFFQRFKKCIDPSVQAKIYFHDYFRKADYERDRLDAIAADMLFEENSLKDLRDSGFRVIRLFQEWPGGEYVRPDSTLGGYLQGQRLIAAGHRNIAAFQFTEDNTVEFKERLNGLQDACAEAGVKLVRINLGRIEDVYNIGHALDYTLAKHQNITAFACTYEAMALSLLDALEARGARVPEDYSVISIDDYYFTSLLSPPLTTFRVPWEEMAEALADNLNSPAPANNLPMRMTFPPLYIAGKSVKSLSHA